MSSVRGCRKQLCFFLIADDGETVQTPEPQPGSLTPQRLMGNTDWSKKSLATFASYPIPHFTDEETEAHRAKGRAGFELPGPPPAPQLRPHIPTASPTLCPQRTHRLHVDFEEALRTQLSPRASTTPGRGRQCPRPWQMQRPGPATPAVASVQAPGLWPFLLQEANGSAFTFVCLATCSFKMEKKLETQ